MPTPNDMQTYYRAGLENDRLVRGAGQLEFERTCEMLADHLPPPPACIWDVGGGPGRYAGWLATRGYEVHLVDPVPLHVEQARLHSVASAQVGDARALPTATASADAVLLLGPLYHLIEAEDRLQALREARRALRPGGRLFAVGISRFASLLDGLFRGVIDDSAFASIVEGDLRDGQHRNPTEDMSYFTTVYFHRPEDLEREVREAGFEVRAVIGLEGPCWLLQDFDTRWADPIRREALREAARRAGSEASLLGVSAHIMVVAEAT